MFDTHKAHYFLPVFKKDEGGDVADAVLARNGPELVHVEFGHGGFPLQAFRYLIEHRPHHLAGHAPLGPEINKHQTTFDVLLEITVGERNDLIALRGGSQPLHPLRRIESIGNKENYQGEYDDKGCRHHGAFSIPVQE